MTPPIRNTASTGISRKASASVPTTPSRSWRRRSRSSVTPHRATSMRREASAARARSTFRSRSYPEVVNVPGAVVANTNTPCTSAAVVLHHRTERRGDAPSARWRLLADGTAVRRELFVRLRPRRRTGCKASGPRDVLPQRLHRWRQFAIARVDHGVRVCLCSRSVTHGLHAGADSGVRQRGQRCDHRRVDSAERCTT